MSAPVELARPSSAVRRRLAMATIAAVAAALSAIGLLAISGWFLTAAAVAGAAGIAAIEAFNYLIPSAAIRLLAIVRTLARYGERVFSHEAALGAMADLRNRLFAALAAQDTRAAPNVSAGAASAQLIGDIEALEDLIVRQPTRPASLSAAIAGVALALLAGWVSALVVAALLAALPFVLAKLSRRWTATPAREAAEALADLRERYVDLASARAEIVAYGLVDEALAELAPTIARLDSARARLFVAEGLIAATLIVYGAFAAFAVLVSTSGPAALTALAILAAAASVEALAALSRTALRQASVEAGLGRLERLLALPAAPLSPAAETRAAPATLTLGDVALLPGGRVLIAGNSGTGKTIVLETLAGLRGEIIAAQIDAAAPAVCPARTLRAQFALSAQAAPMLAGTIADNLRLARPGLKAGDMWAALKVACMAERVQALPAGLDTTLAEGGGLLSGGERKRLSLARALLAGRPWLLLDEPTEGLDAATERELVARLDGWLERTGTGLVLVSHRPWPHCLADRTIEVGAIVGGQT